MPELSDEELARLLADAAELRSRLARLERQLTELTERQGLVGEVGAPPPLPPVPEPPAAETQAPESEPPADIAPSVVPPPPRPPVKVPAEALARERAEAPEPPPVKRPRMSLEQRVGTSWLNKIGIVVMVLAAVFFFQYAVEQGWLSPWVRVLLVALAGALMLGAGEWTLRKQMRIFAAGVTGGGIALLYAAAFAASPKFYGLVSTPIAFALMCLVTAIGVALSLRSGMVTTAILVQIGAYLTPMLLRTGRDEQVVLMGYVIAISAGFLVVAAAKRWSSLPPIAMVGSLLLFAGWFAKYYASAHTGVMTATFAWALFALFAAFAVYASATGRTHRYAAIALPAAAAPAMVLLHLLQGSDLLPKAVLAQWLVLDAIVLGLCFWRRWRWLRLATLAWTTVAVAILAILEWTAMGEASWCAWSWVLLAVFLVDALARASDPARWTGGWLDQFMGVVPVAVMFVAVFHMLRDSSVNAAMAQWLALVLIVLGMCLWRWRGAFRLGALAATCVCSLLQYLFSSVDAGVWSWCVWSWVFFGVFQAEVLMRAWSRRRHTNVGVNAALAAGATAAMFAGTYQLLRASHDDWMGLYTALLGVGAIALAFVVWRSAKRRVLGYAYLGQGLVLLTLAMPIQFDKSSLTVAWAAQAAVAMLLARRLNSRLMLGKSIVVMFLAFVHFALVTVPGDTRLVAAALRVGGVDVTFLLVLAASLTAAAMVSAAILRAGEAIWSDDAERTLAIGLVSAGMAVWAWQTCAQLPAAGATWWWLVLAGGVAAVGLGKRASWLVFCGALMLAATAGKLLVYDTLYRRLAVGAAEDVWVGLNWQFTAATATGALCLACSRVVHRRIPEGPVLTGLWTALGLMGVLVVLWAGSFEIDRYFTAGARELTEKLMQGRQMGYSVWWSACATGMLIGGLLGRWAAIRYMALAVFAVTLGKVLLVDMADVEAGYRIASFLALGALLVGASFLYQRYFRAALVAWDGDPATEPTREGEPPSA